MRKFSFILSFLLATQLAHATPGQRLAAAAKQQIGVTVRYDGRYQRLAYPGGDVPMELGVCTDVVIRAYRRLGIDLQQKVHHDMGVAWTAYPSKWGLRSRDKNIDHRRVLNLATFFRRHGTSLVPSQKPQDYLPGDIVAWLLPGALPHIGIVSSNRSGRGTPLIIHNIGAGAEESNVLFAYKITGHYRYPVTADPAGKQGGAPVSVR